MGRHTNNKMDKRQMETAYRSLHPGSQILRSLLSFVEPCGLLIILLDVYLFWCHCFSSYSPSHTKYCTLHTTTPQHMHRVDAWCSVVTTAIQFHNNNNNKLIEKLRRNIHELHWKITPHEVCLKRGVGCPCVYVWSFLCITRSSFLQRACPNSPPKNRCGSVALSPLRVWRQRLSRSFEWLEYQKETSI